MHIHWLQHVPFEGLGAIETWATQHRHTLSVTRFFDKDPLPLPDELDMLIVMGGPMGVNDTGKYPWLELERLFIGDVIRMGKPVLGVCLGAQLIAAALGATVMRAPQQEIGWFRVFRDRGLPLPWPEELEVFHWHSDTFTLPEDAVRICHSRACENQAFLYDGRVLALQFHIEMTPEGIEAIIENSNDQIVDGEHIQTAEAMREEAANKTGHLHTFLDMLLDILAAKAKL